MRHEVAELDDLVVHVKTDGIHPLKYYFTDHLAHAVAAIGDHGEGDRIACLVLPDAVSVGVDPA